MTQRKYWAICDFLSTRDGVPPRICNTPPPKRSQGHSACSESGWVAPKKAWL